MKKGVPFTVSLRGAGASRKSIDVLLRDSNVTNPGPGSNTPQQTKRHGIRPNAFLGEDDGETSVAAKFAIESLLKPLF